jgi:orotidine-5'-phosphate decarboxylase
MPNSVVLVPGYGAQRASAAEAVVAARADGLGAIVNASRSLMYAFAKSPGVTPGAAAQAAATKMRLELNDALKAAGKSPPAQS